MINMGIHSSIYVRNGQKTYYVLSNTLSSRRKSVRKTDLGVTLVKITLANSYFSHNVVWQEGINKNIVKKGTVPKELGWRKNSKTGSRRKAANRPLLFFLLNNKDSDLLCKLRSHTILLQTEWACQRNSACYLNRILEKQDALL